MSMKGIDTQTMLHRVTDASREQSQALKRPENAQQMAVNRSQVQIEHEQNSIAQKEEVDMVLIGEQSQRNAQQHKGKERDNKKETEQEEQPLPTMPPRKPGIFLRKHIDINV